MAATRDVADGDATYQRRCLLHNVELAVDVRRSDAPFDPTAPHVPPAPLPACRGLTGAARTASRPPHTPTQGLCAQATGMPADAAVEDESPYVQLLCTALEGVLMFGLVGTRAHARTALAVVGRGTGALGRLTLADIVFTAYCGSNTAGKDRTGANKSYDAYLKEVGQMLPQARQAVANVWSISEIRTPRGRARAFVKFALIERRLDQYINVRTTERVLAGWLGVD